MDYELASKLLVPALIELAGGNVDDGASALAGLVTGFAVGVREPGLAHEFAHQMMADVPVGAASDWDRLIAEVSAALHGEVTPERAAAEAKAKAAANAARSLLAKYLLRDPSVQPQPGEPLLAFVKRMYTEHGVPWDEDEDRRWAEVVEAATAEAPRA